MTISRTVEHGHMLPSGAVNAGAGTETIIARCTADKDTSVAIKKIGLSRGVVVNKSGEEVDVVYYGAFSPQGTAWPLKDSNKNASEQTLGDNDEMVALPSEVGSAPWLIPVVTQGVGTGTGTFTTDEPATLYFQFQD